MLLKLVLVVAMLFRFHKCMALPDPPTVGPAANVLDVASRHFACVGCTNTQRYQRPPLPPVAAAMFTHARGSAMQSTE